MGTSYCCTHCISGPICGIIGISHWGGGTEAASNVSSDFFIGVTVAPTLW
jgi:hypothetical protein